MEAGSETLQLRAKPSVPGPFGAWAWLPERSVTELQASPRPAAKLPAIPLRPAAVTVPDAQNPQPWLHGLAQNVGSRGWYRWWPGGDSGVPAVSQRARPVTKVWLKTQRRPWPYRGAYGCTYRCPYLSFLANFVISDRQHWRLEGDSAGVVRLRGFGP